MFQILNDIKYNKRGNSHNRSDFKEQFIGYNIQRWVSMYSLDNVEILNCTVNILWKALTDEQNYKLMVKIIPPNRSKCQYIKVKKKDPKLKGCVVDEVLLESSAVFEESADKLNESLIEVFGDTNE